jgi:uncharacterized Zn finger protein (UPF0148 family)
MPAEPATNLLKFSCPRCKSKLRVKPAMAGRYIQCPKCQNKIPVPSSQAEADEDSKAIGLKELTYEVPKNCMNCKAKLRKGTVICVKCGYDYRLGKIRETEDRTKRIGDDVTYEQIFKAPMRPEVGQMAAELVQGFLAISGAGITILLGAWLVFAFLLTTLDVGVVFMMVLGLRILVAIGVTFLQGALWFDTMVDACTRAAFNRKPEGRGLILHGLFNYLVRLIGLAPLVLVGYLFFRQNGLDFEQWHFGGPILMAFALAFTWNMVYTTMAIAAYAVDATFNPLVVAYWFGRSFVDLMIMVVYFIFFIALVWGLPMAFLGYMAYTVLEDPTFLWVISFFIGILAEVLYAFTCVSLYTMLGLILRKNSEW